MIKHTPFLLGADTDTTLSLVTRTLTFILEAAMCVPAKNMIHGYELLLWPTVYMSTLKAKYTKHRHLHYTICHNSRAVSVKSVHSVEDWFTIMQFGTYIAK